ncbi:DUF2946 domain-containing protein [Noviherbaspirillum massiliense]|uniref:DUF2946 domain-containing protein n=2 Tax=Noviherbaspirillum massiliense TaxID=1465823 RepID=UPI0005551505|nr:DUF2946 domain-containing protein [Noviherbaspirillum massiliense]
MSHRTRRLAAMIASFAILLALLAPSVSQALAAGKGSGFWQEICSVNAAKLYLADNDSTSGAPSPASKNGLAPQCDFCLTHAGSFGLAPAAFTIPLAIQPSVPSFPPLFYQAPRRLFIWSRPPSHAPPVHL